jgi:hypothetical protein
MLTLDELDWLAAAEARLRAPIGPVTLTRLDLGAALALLRRLDGGRAAEVAGAKVAGVYTEGSGV